MTGRDLPPVDVSVAAVWEARKIVEDVGDRAVVLVAGHGQNSLMVIHLHNPGTYDIKIKMEGEGR